MQYAGYAHLINQHNITAIPPAISVEVRSVTRKETIGQTIAVPAKLAPAPDDRLGHILFAIKHEGITSVTACVVRLGLPMCRRPRSCRAP